ncbi:MAG: hypothetical protein Fur0018_15150 [Anaerolineales bacterium]
MTSSRDTLWNILTILFLLGTVCVLGTVLVIFVNPNAALNPFPKPTVPVALSLPTETPTPRNQLPPTWTPTQTQPPTPTSTPSPSRTPAAPTSTPTRFVLPSWTPSPTNTATPRPSYTLSGGAPTWVEAKTVNPARGCDWMGVGGQVLATTGEPVNGLTVFLGGKYEGKTLQLTTTTAAGSPYGDGGFEITIASEPNSTKETLYLQLFGADGVAVSKQYYFRTYDSCTQNLILFKFNQEP